MIIKCGIIGLPNIGKSTLFNLLTEQKVKNKNFPFCTIKSNIGHSIINSKKINKIIKFTKNKKIFLPKIKYFDIAGLIEGAHKGLGLGNQFLEDIRKTDILIHVVRIFKNPEIININKKINPIYDINIIKNEIILSDLLLLEKIKNKYNKKEYINTINLFIKNLEENKYINKNKLNNKQLKIIKNINLLTNKKNIYLLNIDNTLKHKKNKIEKIKKYINNIEYKPIILNVDIKKSLHQNKKKLYTQYKINKKIIKKLNFIKFFTIKNKKITLWLTNKKNNIINSIKQIHNDFVKKFIKAEVINFKKFIRYKGWNKIKKMGKIKIKGKKYKIKNNDIIHIMINKNSRNFNNN